MNRSFLALCSALALTGCVSFLPSYDAAVHKRLDAAVGEIDKIGAALAPGYQPQPPFDKFEPYYIAALANLKSAEATAAGRTVGYKGSLPARAAATVSRAIANCRRSVEDLLQRHRTAGIDQNLFELHSTRETCAIPTMMESRLKR